MPLIPATPTPSGDTTTPYTPVVSPLVAVLSPPTPTPSGEVLVPRTPVANPLCAVLSPVTPASLAEVDTPSRGGLAFASSVRTASAATGRAVNTMPAPTAATPPRVS